MPFSDSIPGNVAKANTRTFQGNKPDFPVNTGTNSPFDDTIVLMIVITLVVILLCLINAIIQSIHNCLKKPTSCPPCATTNNDKPTDFDDETTDGGSTDNGDNNSSHGTQYFHNLRPTRFYRDLADDVEDLKVAVEANGKREREMLAFERGFRCAAGGPKGARDEQGLRGGRDAGLGQCVEEFKGKEMEEKKNE